MSYSVGQNFGVLILRPSASETTLIPGSIQNSSLSSINSSYFTSAIGIAVFVNRLAFSG